MVLGRWVDGVLAATAIGAVVGCGGDPLPAPDASALPGMDAFTEPSMDAHTASPDARTGECEGAATACSSLDPAACTSVMGCVVTSCRGFPVACARLLTMAECDQQDGCSWSGACGGSPRECTTLSDTECAMQIGCVVGSRGCSGFATACSAFERARCLEQPGCMYTPDAGRDAGPPDAAPMPCAPGSTPLRVRVVGANDAPMAGAAVRTEGESCGIGFEATSGADGVVTFMVDAALGPWSITAARAGYSAVSVVDVLGFDFAGDVRLDAITPPSTESYPASGTFSPVRLTSLYKVDTYDFETVTDSRGSWSSNHYVESPPSPLRFVALELARGEEALDIAVSPEMVRPRGPVTDVALTFSSTPVRLRSLRVTLPPAGPLSVASPSYFEVQHALPSGSYVVVGSAALAAFTTSELTFAVRDFATFPMNFLYTSSDTGLFQLNVFRSGPNEDATIAIGQLEDLSMSGLDLADARVTASGTGWAWIGFHVGESETQPPRWRIFGALAADGAPTSIEVPRLPTGISAADLGLLGATSVLPIVIETEAVPPWSLRASNQGVMGYRATAAGSYQSIDSRGR